MVLPVLNLGIKYNHYLFSPNSRESFTFIVVEMTLQFLLSYNSVLQTLSLWRPLGYGQHCAHPSLMAKVAGGCRTKTSSLGGVLGSGFSKSESQYGRSGACTVQCLVLHIYWLQTILMGPKNAPISPAPMLSFASAPIPFSLCFSCPNIDLGWESHMWTQRPFLRVR